MLDRNALYQVRTGNRKRKNMPKELIHFHVAQATAARLADTRFAEAAARHESALLLGSVFHDALFYAVTPGAAPAERLAHMLHGADGQDTFALLGLQAELVRQCPKRGPATAAFVGMASHIMTDAVMHPMVWYFSGNYYGDNPLERTLVRQRHRALESLMDMTLVPEMIDNSRYRLRHQLASLNEERPWPVQGLAQMAGLDGPRMQRAVSTGWRIFGTLQSLFPIRPLAQSLFALRRILPDSAAEVAALFYAPQLLAQQSPLQGSIAYRHPATGEHHVASLPQMAETAADRAEALCRNFAPHLFDNAPPPSNAAGPSMDAGLADTPASAMRHFANPPYPEI